MAEKEVFYYQYCNKCEYEPIDGGDEPCNTCLNYPYNEDSHKPIMFSEKDL